MNKSFQRKIVLFLLFLSAYITNSTAQTVQDISGKVYQVKSAENITGTALLFPEFLNGEIRFNNQKEVKGLLLNYDALNNVLLFKNAAGEIRETTEQVESFKIYHATNNNNTLTLFRSGFGKILDFGSNTFYEVLYDGKSKLLKKVNKYQIEKIGYNAGAKEIEIKEKEFYFVHKDGKLVQISKNQKSILTILADKREALEKFIQENKINLKNEQEIVKVLTFYDQL